MIDENLKNSTILATTESTPEINKFDQEQTVS